MGIMGDKLIADYYGHRIEIEASAKAIGGQFRLIIDNEKADEAYCAAGSEVSLRGKILMEKTAHFVNFRIKQGWFGTKYKLFVNDKEHPFQKLK